MSPQHGPTCVTCSQPCTTCIPRDLSTWTSSLPMFSSLARVVLSWGILGCCWSSHKEGQSHQEGRMRISGREIPDTWPLSCSEESLVLRPMFSGENMSLSNKVMRMVNEVVFTLRHVAIRIISICLYKCIC